jgi:two-component system, cell cycle sensor histidine kinase and response regulator CckA
MRVPEVPERPVASSVPKLHYGPPISGYLLAAALIALAAVGRVKLTYGGVAATLPFLLYYPAIAAVSFMAGAGPGLAAVLLGAIVAILYFPQPPGIGSWIAIAVLGPLHALVFSRLRYLLERGRATARELARFKFIADHASDWILLLRESGHIHYANVQACSELGCTAAELAGRHIESFVLEEQRPALRALLEEARSGAAKPIEFTFARRDKSPAVLELGCTGVLTEHDRVIYAAARDVGERKQIERRLHEARHWESLGAMAGGLAHEFNNLLTTILGNASLAKEHLAADHVSGQDDIASMLETVISASERSADLVRMLLSVSGYRARHKEILKLEQFLDWMLENRPMAANVRISKDIQVAECLGDRRSFDVLLWSLISNAAEAYGTEGGEVRIRICYGAPPRHAAPGGTMATFEEDSAAGENSAGPGEYLGIVVEDCGAGMPPEVLERAFDPFYSTKFTGRGLGLPAVRGIVRAYKGKLLLESAPAKGTRVEVWLPGQ